MVKGKNQKANLIETKRSRDRYEDPNWSEKQA